MPRSDIGEELSHPSRHMFEHERFPPLTKEKRYEAETVPCAGGDKRGEKSG
jgi:hypothetical protein